MDLSYVFLNSSNPHLSDAIEHDELPPTPPMESIFIQSDTENTSDEETAFGISMIYNPTSIENMFIMHVINNKK